MALTFNPLHDFDRFSAGFANALQGPMTMPLDVFKNGDAYVVRTDLPGVAADDIDIDVDGSQLTIRAERDDSNESSAAQWISHERSHGESLRQLTLGDGLDTEHIQADYENGVLTLTIPVSEKAKPRKIQVTTKAQTAKPVVDAASATAQPKTSKPAAQPVSVA